jgi:pilus assembly protein Flp/PilA
MKMLWRELGLFAVDRHGVTALEYALVAAVMGALIVTAMTTLGNNLDTAYTSIGTLMTMTAEGM